MEISEIVSIIHSDKNSARFQNALIIFDVDGTLTPQRPSSSSPFSRTLLPNVASTTSILLECGITFAIASNQGGMRKDRNPRLTFGSVIGHLKWVSKTIGAKTIKFASTPSRKKPSPLMLVEIINELGFSKENVIFVGDSEDDKSAAENAKIKFVLAKDFFVR